MHKTRLALLGMLVFMLGVTGVSARQSPPMCGDQLLSGKPPIIAKPELAQGTKILCNIGYATLHSGISRGPLWSAEKLTPERVAAAYRRDERTNDFHADERLKPDERSELDDYRRSGLDRGHMAPSGDMTDPQSDHESFALSNIVPQAGGLNRRSWADLEGWVRRQARDEPVVVVTGPLFEGTSLRRLNSRVLVPTHVWKAVASSSRGAAVYVATNTDTPDYAILSVAAFEARSGINPFPALNARTKRTIGSFPPIEDIERPRR